MSLNHSDLVKLVEDLRYVAQSGGGGGGAVQSGGAGAGSSLLNGMKLFVMLLKVFFYIFIAYILYVVWFKGYPKIVFDLGTLSMYKRENLDKLFEEHHFLLNHFKFFIKKPHELPGASPNYLFSSIVGRTRVSEHIQNLESYISLNYNVYKFDKRYVRAFADFYLLYNTVASPLDSPGAKRKIASSVGGITAKVNVWPEQLANPEWNPPPYSKKNLETHKYWEKAHAIEQHLTGPNQNSIVDADKMVPRGPPEYFITYSRFYELYTEILNRYAVVEKRRKNRDAKASTIVEVAQMEFNDKLNNRPLLRKIEGLKTRFLILRSECSKQVKDVVSNGCTYFVIIPDDSGSISQVSSELVGRYSEFQSNELYSPSKAAADLSDYSWYMFEVLKADSIANLDDLEIKNPGDNAARGRREAAINQLNSMYASLAQQLEAYLSGKPFETRIILTAYMAMPRDRKKHIHTSLLTNYPEIDISKEMLDFLQKYPTFSSIYLNSKISDKPGVWRNTMRAYQVLMTTNKDLSRLDMKSPSDIPKLMGNLIANGRGFKQFVNSLFVLDMFLNDFQENMTILYEQQFRSDVKFLRELWDPFYQQIVELRVGPYFRKMLSASNMARSFYNFWQLWKVIGRMMQRLKREIGAAFKRGVTMPSDPPPT